MTFRDDRNCREEMEYFWKHSIPNQMKDVTPDLFLRMMIHNRQAVADAAVLRHYKPPATHWNELMMSIKQSSLLHPYIILAAQRSLVSTIAVLPLMQLRETSIQYAQKVMYNLLIANLDFTFLKKHNKEKSQSLLGSHFKSQLAQCTELDSVKELVQQETVYSISF